MLVRLFNLYLMLFHLRSKLENMSTFSSQFFSRNFAHHLQMWVATHRGFSENKCLLLVGKLSVYSCCCSCLVAMVVSMVMVAMVASMVMVWMNDDAVKED